VARPMTGSNKSGLYDKRISDGSFLNLSADGTLSIKRLHMGAVHRSVQPIIIRRKAPVFLKSANRNFGNLRGERGPKTAQGGPVSFADRRCYASRIMRGRGAPRPLRCFRARLPLAGRGDPQ
jgi:hypothetical protein